MSFFSLPLLEQVLIPLGALLFAFGVLKAFRWPEIARLLVNEERLKFALEGSNEGLWDWDIQNDIVYFSPRWFEMLGYGPNELPQNFDTWSMLVHPEDMPRVLAALNAHLEGRSPNYEAEHRLKMKDRQWKWVLTRGKVTSRDRRTGKPRRCVGTQADISHQKEVEESLRQSEKRQRELMQIAPVGIFVTDVLGKCKGVNQWWSEITGLSLEEALGDGWASAILPEDRYKVSESWNQAVFNSRNFSLEFRFMQPNGSIRWVIVKAIPIRDPEGNVYEYMGSVQDITSLRMVQNENDLYKSALDRAAIVAFTDPQRKITYANEKFCEISGFTRDELVGNDHRVVNSGVMGRAFFREMWKVISQGRTWRGEICNRNKKGEIYWVDTTIVLLVDSAGKIQQYTAIRHEITSRKKLQEQLLRANQIALAATRAKSEFLANMSHEIRTPMNGVIGMCNLLLASLRDPEHVDKLRVIQQCGKSLLDLINDILDFSKIEANRIDLKNEAYSIAKSTREIITLMQGLASQKGLKIEFDPAPGLPEWVCGDSNRFRQILVNLLSNAVKFSSKGDIRVAARANRLGSDELEILYSVQDAGIGIPQAAIAKLFVPFSQVDGSTTRAYGGTGLGLAISRGLCERMGGRIWVESQEGHGSTFHFTFKAAPAEAVKAEPEVELGNFGSDFAQSHPLNILIAEDNKTNQLVLLGFLERLGYQAEAVADGREALVALEKSQFDLVLMDCHMPELDGFETTQEIRRRFGHSQWPYIVAVTASTMKEDVDRCVASGMNSVLSKPLTVSALVQVLKTVQRSEGSYTVSSGAELFSDKPVEANRKSSDPMDSKKFWQGFTGMESFALNLIREFLGSMSSMVSQIDEAVLSGDLKQLRMSAHALKGAVSNFAAPPSEELASQLEQCGASGDLQRAALVLERLHEEVARLRTALEGVQLEGAQNEELKRAS